MRRTRRYYDVVVAGAGPGGLAAGLFTARYGLTTLIFDRGKSLLRQCAYLDNYLGFPGGIEVETYLTLAREQAIDAGCHVERARVVGVETAAASAARFRIHTRQCGSYTADRFIAASPYDVEYLRQLDEATLFGPDGLPAQAHDSSGRTAVDGLYLTGTLAGVESQALICAGQGARAALAVIADRRREHGYWEATARHLDWLVPKGRYDRERWAERVRTYFRDSAPVGCDFPPEQVEARIEEWIRDKRRQQIDPAEAERRGKRWRYAAREQIAHPLPLPATRGHR